MIVFRLVCLITTQKNSSEKNQNRLRPEKKLGCSLWRTLFGLPWQTSQLLLNKISQHKNDVKNRDGHTTLSDHSVEKQHYFNFGEITIVYRE